MFKETYKVVEATDGQGKPSLEALIRNGNASAAKRLYGWVDTVEEMTRQNIEPEDIISEEIIERSLEKHRMSLLKGGVNNNTRFVSR